VVYYSTIDNPGVLEYTEAKERGELSKQTYPTNSQMNTGDRMGHETAGAGTNVTSPSYMQDELSRGQDSIPGGQ
jgi:hypothetical protein